MLHILAVASSRTLTEGHFKMALLVGAVCAFIGWLRADGNRVKGAALWGASGIAIVTLLQVCALALNY